MPPPYCYSYPRPAVTVDLAVVARVAGGMRVLLIRRWHDPFADHWALPGGFLDADERAAVAAVRELREETGLVDPGPVSFLGVYDAPGRDPRGWTISLAHVAVLNGPVPEVAGGDDASEAAWLDPARFDTPGAADRLAFDHAQILADALAWLARATPG